MPIMFSYSQPEVKKFLSRVFRRVRYEVEGLEHLPWAGPAILIMNHTGWEEILLTLLTVPRPIKIVGMHELMFLDDPTSRARIFDTTYAKDFGPVRRALTTFLGKLLGEAVRRQLREFGFIPARVFTETWRPILGSNGIRETLHALESGEVVLIFPEGGYKRDGVMRPFKRGLGLLLRLLHRRGLPVPVVAAAQHTASCISPTLSNRYVPRLVFGSPLTFNSDSCSPHTFDETVVRTLQDQVNALLPRAWPDAPPQTYFLRASDPPLGVKESLSR